MASKKEVYRNCLIRLLAISLITFALSLSVSFAQPSIKIEPEKVVKRVKVGDFVEVPIKIINDGNIQLSLKFSVDGGIAPLVNLDKGSVTIDPGLTEQAKLTIF